MSPESVENLLDALAHARAQAEAVGERMAQLIKDLIPTEIAKQIDDVQAELEPERRAIEERAAIIEARVVEATKGIGKTVKGQSLQAVYVSAQRKMGWKDFDRYLVRNPELAAELLAMVEVGEPSAQIRKV